MTTERRCHKQVVGRLMEDFEEGLLTDRKGDTVTSRERASRIAEDEATRLCTAVKRTRTITEARHTKKDEHGRILSMQRLSRLLAEVPVCDVLDRIDFTDYKSNRRYYEKLVFPLMQMLASVSYQTNVGAELNLLFPEVIRLNREASRISLLPLKNLCYYEHIRIGKAFSPSAVLAFVPNGRHCDVVIAVRGTKKQADIVADLTFWRRDLTLMNADSLTGLLKAGQDPKVHGGFGDYHVKLYAAVMPRILHTMSLFQHRYAGSDFRFFLTGHSMGSLSTIMGLTFADAFRAKVFSFSYGGVRLGNDELNELLSHPRLRMKRVFRVYNRGDVFPWLAGIGRREHLDEYVKRTGRSLKEIRGLDYQSALEKATGRSPLRWYANVKFLHSNFSYDGKHVYTM